MANAQARVSVAQRGVQLHVKIRSDQCRSVFTC
jgi:hypothetical protein